MVISGIKSKLFKPKIEIKLDLKDTGIDSADYVIPGKYINWKSLKTYSKKGLK